VAYYLPSSGALSGTSLSSYTPVFSPFMAFDGSYNFQSSGLISGATKIVAAYNTGGSIGFLTPTLTSPYAVATDTNSYFWMTSNGTATSGALLQKTKISSSGGVTTATCSATNYARGTGVVIDSSNSAWVSDSYNSKLVKFTNGTGAACSSPSISYSTITSPTGLAIDGNNTLWTVNASDQVGATTNAGVAVSPALGYAPTISGTLVGPYADSAGNIWFLNSTDNTVHQMIGVSTPVLTPLAAGVKAKTLGTKP
jgi:hypothetical protein